MVGAQHMQVDVVAGQTRAGWLSGNGEPQRQEGVVD